MVQFPEYHSIGYSDSTNFTTLKKVNMVLPPAHPIGTATARFPVAQLGILRI
jgi:hypothetical protein